MKSVFTTIAFSILIVISAFANNNNDPATATDTTIPTDNCFFTDPDEKVLFIDLEEINGFAKEIVIKNSNDEVIFHEQLWDKFDLNGNIYEWSFAEENTDITIELYTFTKVLTKEILTTTSPLAIK